MKKLLALLEQLQAILEAMQQEDKPNELYMAAFASIGLDISPRDVAPDEVACAESLCEVVKDAFPELNFPTIISTAVLYQHLTKSPSFVQVDTPVGGEIIISPTGTGNGKLKNGHVGIMGRKKSQDGSLWIMGNDSRTGIWSANFTLQSWRAYYERKGGFPVLFFKPV
jgi:hypothetical protein